MVIQKKDTKKIKAAIPGQILFLYDPPGDRYVSVKVIATYNRMGSVVCISKLDSDNGHRRQIVGLSDLRARK